MKSGRLIVLEGTDGSGKSTQFQLLRQALGDRPYHQLVFPQYGQPSAALIELYLGGAFGSRPGDVSPHAASTFYAVDRYASYKTGWEAHYHQGGLVLADRYTSSNAVHQGAKCLPEEREDFFRWLDQLEHQQFGLPRPDLVLYLDMPTEKALELLGQRQENTATQGDIHEVDPHYLATCRDCGLEAARLLDWQQIPCTTSAGGLRSPQEIHQDIWQQVTRFLENP